MCMLYTLQCKLRRYSDLYNAFQREFVTYVWRGDTHSWHFLVGYTRARANTIRLNGWTNSSLVHGAQINAHSSMLTPNIIDCVTQMVDLSPDPRFVHQMA